MEKEQTQEQLNQLQAELKQSVAVKLGEYNENVEKAVTRLTDLTEKLANQQAEHEAKLAEIAEAEKVKALEAEKLSLTEKLASATPEEKNELRKALSAEYGDFATGLVFETDRVEKILNRPLSGNEANYEDIKTYRNTRDQVMLVAAGLGGMTVTHQETGMTQVDKTKVRVAIDLLQKAGAPMIDEVAKGINDSMDTLETNLGLQMVPTQILSADINQGVWVALRVANNFQEFPMPGPTFSLNVKTARSRAYRMSQGTAVANIFQNLATAHPFETDLVTWNAEKIAALIPFSDELNEDSVLAVAQEARNEIIYGLAEARDDATLNGSVLLNDLDNAGADGSRLWNNTGDPGAADVRNAWDGIRKLSGTYVDCSTWDEDAVNSLQRQMDKYAQNPDDLILFVSVRDYLRALAWDNVKTRDTYGDQMTLLRGELARIYGIPIIPTSHCYTNLASTGVYTGAGQTKSTAVLVHKDGYAFGNRRSVTVETGRNPLGGISWVLATQRLDFQKRFMSGEPVSAVGRNI